MKILCCILCISITAIGGCGRNTLKSIDATNTKNDAEQGANNARTSNVKKYVVKKEKVTMDNGTVIEKATKVYNE